MTDRADDDAPRAFISHSWDDRDHIEWVLTLSTRLRGDGVDVVLDRWDTSLGSDLAVFMERAAGTEYRVLLVVSDSYTEKADKGEGGVGYEKRVITGRLMRDLHTQRLVPILRNNPEGTLPAFMAPTKYVDFRDDATYEDGYYELLQDLHGVSATPRPPLGRNPFLATDDAEVAVALREDSARYVMPALEGAVEFPYSNNSGRYRIGAGDREFELAFSEAGHGSIYIYNDPPGIKTVALARGVSSPQDVGDAAAYDGSSRSRTLRVGDAAILRNVNNYWAAVFVDEVTTRDTSSSQEPTTRFRFYIPPVPHPDFSTG